MKALQKIFLVLLCSLFTLANATDVFFTGEWSFNGNLAFVSYNNSDSEQEHFIAMASHSKTGEQRLYFLNTYVENKNMCERETTYPENTTIIFNTQAVKMLSWCKKDSGQLSISLTPETERGHVFLIKLFSQSVNPILIRYSGETFLFPVTGFTKVWNNAGGDAL